MSRGEFVRNSIWSDPDFEGLSLDAGMLYLWAFTNPLCNMAGLYKVSENRMTESKVTRRKLEAALVELRTARMAFYELAVLWVRARVKRLHTQTPNYAKAIAKDVSEIDPQHPLRGAFLFEYMDHKWLRAALVPLNVVSHNVHAPLALASQEVEGMAIPSVNLLEGSNALHCIDNEEPEGFVEWLDHHEATTSRRAPRVGTKARADVASSFSARRAEGYELSDLKLASVGAHKDDFRRERGYDKAESVLRPTKVHDLIENGRRRPSESRANAAAYADDSPCRDCRKTGKLTQGLCDECFDSFAERATA